jgi:hypothetical protein
MINPEALDLSALPSLPLSDRKRLPTTPCIYFAMSNGTVQYIGRAVNPRSRWSAEYHHHYKDLQPDSLIAWLEVSSSDLLPEIEKALIAWFKPPLNTGGKKVFVEPVKRVRKTKPNGKICVAILASDLDKLKALRREGEYIYMAFHRIVDNAEMYDAILKSGEVATNE